MTRGKLFLAHLIVTAAVATMIGLGVWQLSRAHWKDQLVARYAAARDLPEIAFPTIPLKGDPPLFRRARGECLEVAGWRTAPGSRKDGEPGFAIIADCRTGAEGPGMAVELGWSKNPNARPSWSGGTVHGVIGPDRQSLLRLVADAPLGGLEPAAPPSLEAIPNNHRSYAIQWFLFAAIAMVIYGVALRRKLRA